MCGQLAKEGLGLRWRGGCGEEQWGVGAQWEPGLVGPAGTSMINLSKSLSGRAALRRLGPGIESFKL